MTKGNSTSVIAIRLPDPVVARIKTMARRKRQNVNEMLKKVILGYVAGEYYSEEQVAKLCELEPLAFQGETKTLEDVLKVDKSETKPLDSPEPPSPGGFPKVGRNDPCPCGSGKKYKRCHGSNS